MSNFNIITKNFKTVGIKESIIRSIVERCIRLYLQDAVGTIDDVSEMQYCPAWKYIRKQKRKSLNGIRIRMIGQADYTEIKDKDIKSSGLSLGEIYEFLKKSSAQKTMIG